MCGFTILKGVVDLRIKAHAFMPIEHFDCQKGLVQVVVGWSVIVSTQVLFPDVTCLAHSHNEYIVVMDACSVVDLDLCLEESRVYPGYQSQNEGKCPGVFPEIIIWKKMLIILIQYTSS